MEAEQASMGQLISFATVGSVVSVVLFMYGPKMVAAFLFAVLKELKNIPGAPALLGEVAFEAFPSALQRGTTTLVKTALMAARAGGEEAKQARHVFAELLAETTTDALKQSLLDDQFREVLMGVLKQVVEASLRDEELKDGVKALLIEALKDKEIAAAGIKGFGKGITEAALAPFKSHKNKGNGLHLVS